VRAVLTYARAVDARKNSGPTAARELFLVAAGELAAAGVPLAQKARMYTIDNDRSMTAPQVVDALDRWLAEGSLDERRYPALVANVRWSRGVWNLRAGRPQPALDDNEAARALFHYLGERDSVASINLMLSEPYEYAGDLDKAARLRFSVMAHLAASGNEQPHVLDVFRLSAMTALREGMPMVAALYLDRQLAATDVPSLYDTRFRLLLWRSAAHRVVGEHGAAERDLRDARALAPKIPDQKLRETALRDADVVRDRLRHARGRAEREQILEDAVTFARARGLTFRLPQLHLEQGLEHFRAGRLEAAEASFYEALDRLEEQRRTIADEELRGSIVDTRHAVHDALVTLLCRQSRYGRAFDVVERSRARSLFDRVSQRPAPVEELAPVSAIAASLSDDTAIVEMAQVGGSLAVWLVSRRGVRFVAMPIERDELQRRVDRFRLALYAGDETAARAASRALHDAAVAPWYRHAKAFERLVFVPHDELSGVPFAALLDRASGKFLVQSHVVTVAPSANVFATCAMRDRERATRGGPTLVVAPAASGSAGGGAVLPASREEASEVARQYETVDVLEGFLATPSEFVARAPRARYIHFAGHATASRGGARMIFAPDAGGVVSTLGTDEIRSLRLDTTRAVVLAACVSGAERAGSNQGTSSLARAFLAAGVPMVVGTLRDVDDEVAARLSRRLHVHLARGHDPAAALRLAQLQMLGSQHPGSARMRSWAAFAAFGGANK
jgi:CHAT domain-containing protein